VRGGFHGWPQKKKGNKETKKKNKKAGKKKEGRPVGGAEAADDAMRRGQRGGNPVPVKITAKSGGRTCEGGMLEGAVKGHKIGPTV